MCLAFCPTVVYIRKRFFSKNWANLNSERVDKKLLPEILFWNYGINFSLLLDKYPNSDIIKSGWNPIYF
jgi:hypothetical protein